MSQPRTDEERTQVAQVCTRRLGVSLPTVVDRIDDAVSRAYAAFPDRIHIIDAEGRVAYKGRPAPLGCDVSEARAGLDAVLGGAELPPEAGPRPPTWASDPGGR